MTVVWQYLQGRTGSVLREFSTHAKQMLGKKISGFFISQSWIFQQCQTNLQGLSHKLAFNARNGALAMNVFLSMVKRIARL